MSIARSSLTSPLLRSSVVGPARNSGIATRSFSLAKSNAGEIPVAASAAGGDGGAAITVGIKAGPRFETQPGLAHVLKNYTFKSNARRTALGLVRETDLRGGLLSTTLTKEHLFLTAQFAKGEEEFFAQLLGDVLSTSKFLAYEYNETVVPQVQTEYAQALNEPTVLGFDQLTQTAYRQRGLGASLFSTPASPISNDQAAAYAHSVFAKDNIAVVGSAVDPSRLEKLVGTYFKDVRPNKGSIVAGSNKYFGGDARVAYAPPHGVEGPRAHYGHYWIGFEGGAGADASPEFAILRSYFGGKSSVKWGAGHSPLAQIGEKVPGAHADAFNLGFSDSGLFGFYITAPTDKVVLAVKEATLALKNVAQGIQDGAFAMARGKALTEAAEEADRTSGEQHISVAGHLLNTNSVRTAEETIAKIEAVKASDVSSAASKLLKSKLTTVAVGDVHKLPYADECF